MSQATAELPQGDEAPGPRKPTQVSLLDAPVSFNPRAPPPPPSDTPSWFTPLPHFLEIEDLLLSLGLITGLFDLDPCGHPEAPVSLEILRRGGVVYFGEDQDGLSFTWKGHRPFVNSPFDSPTMNRFLKGMHERRAAGFIREMVLHGPAWTDRAWWQDHVEPDRLSGEAWVRFERGRLPYGWPGYPVNAGGGGQFPSATVAWKPKP